MAFEVVLEAVLPAVGRIFIYVFLEIIFHIVLYLIGYGFLKIVTLGKHPKEFISLRSSDKSDYKVSLVGLVVCVMGILALFYFK